MEPLFLRLSNLSSRREAFEELVHTYTEQLYITIHHFLLNHDDTNDVLQNTFMKAWQGLKEFRGESRISTWLYRIAVNESLTFLKRQRQHFSLDNVDTSIIEKLMSDTFFYGDEAEAKLIEAIATLPDKQRIVFNLRYYNEMSYEAMSELLNTSSSALRSSYHFATEKIREILKKEL